PTTFLAGSAAAGPGAPATGSGHGAALTFLANVSATGPALLRLAHGALPGGLGAVAGVDRGFLDAADVEASGRFVAQGGRLPFAAGRGGEDTDEFWRLFDDPLGSLAWRLGTGRFATA